MLLWYSAGDDVGLPWSRARSPSNSALSITLTVNAANWRASLIWTSVNRSTVVYVWRTENKNFNSCLILKLRSVSTTWRPIPKRTCVIGWTVFAKCAICMILSRNIPRQPPSQVRYCNWIWNEILKCLIELADDAISQQPITKDPSVTGKLQQQYNTSNVSSDTTTTSINSSTGSTLRQSPLNDIVRPLTNAATNQVSHSSSNLLVLQQRQNNNQNNNNDSIAYVNTEYTNRETLLCDVYLTKQQPQNRSANPTANVPNANQTSTLYLNAATLQHHYHHQQQKSLDTLTKKSSSTSSPLNTVIRKIPENLVLNNSTSPTGLRDTQYEKQLVQSSPAPSTASGPYIPISECFSGSPKFMVIHLIKSVHWI